jgi:ribonuclease D
MFEVSLDKQETRSDWLARPLTQRQLDYAAVDVQYLHAMEKILSKALAEQQREDWFAEETQALFTLVEGRKDHSDYYLRVKGAWRLGVKSLTALNRLCDWRENTARSSNRPRAHIIKDSVLIELARRLPSAQDQLHGIEDWYPRSVKRHGRTVLKQIADSANDSPVPVMPQPLPKFISILMREMRDSMGRVAQDIQIPQEFLCNKKELESILRSSMEGQCQWPERLNQGWRLEFVQPALQEVLDSTEAL